ncbi:MAG: hypothetical protein IPJ13_26365 [Saprospiraceae bacterium]|nr:hypothetical protein [Saprospiraceae bacterium]
MVFFSGGMTKEVYTNDQGIAYVQHASTGMATVYINGREVGRMRVPGEGHFYNINKFIMGFSTIFGRHII